MRRFTKTIKGSNEGEILSELAKQLGGNDDDAVLEPTHNIEFKSPKDSPTVSHIDRDDEKKAMLEARAEDRLADEYDDADGMFGDIPLPSQDEEIDFGDDDAYVGAESTHDEAPIIEKVAEKKAPAPTGVERKDATPVQSVRSSFDPGETQNGLEDLDNEGGVYQHRSTKGAGTFSGNNRPVELKDEAVELSGFQAKIDNSEQVITVVKEYKNISSAKAAINGNKYVFVSDGELAFATIVSGQPSISNETVELAIYTNGEWKRP